MKIVIVGAGAIGSLFAGYLSKTANLDKQTTNEIWLLAKDKKRADKINSEGIIIDEPKSPHKIDVKASYEPEKIGTTDLIIICVKSYNTKEAVKNILPIVKDDTLVLTIQNGIGNVEIISDIYI